jgi:hypothetical protein
MATNKDWKAVIQTVGWYIQTGGRKILTVGRQYSLEGGNTDRRAQTNRRVAITDTREAETDSRAQTNMRAGNTTTGGRRQTEKQGIHRQEGADKQESREYRQESADKHKSDRQQGDRKQAFKSSRLLVGRWQIERQATQGADPPSPNVAMAGKTNLNEEITPLLPAGIGERCSQTISNLGHAALLRAWELPL